jgi:hypothetical protein
MPAQSPARLGWLLTVVLAAATACTSSDPASDAESSSPPPSVTPTKSGTKTGFVLNHPRYPKNRCHPQGRPQDPLHTTLGTAAVWPGDFDRGFGEVKPDHIFNGGDPSSNAFVITWFRWGAPTACGYGLMPVYRPDTGLFGPQAGPVQLRVEGLQMCDGHLSYKRLYSRGPRPWPDAYPRAKWSLWYFKDLCDPKSR